MKHIFAEPDVIIHECTQHFDFTILRSIFGVVYIVMSMVTSPVDLGYPASRPRRWTIMLHRARRTPAFTLTRPVFLELFGRRRIASGHVFWFAPTELVATHIRKMAGQRLYGRGNGDEDDIEADIDIAARDVLQPGVYQRLLNYERTCRRSRRRPRFVVNLCQNVTFMRSYFASVFS